MSQQIDYILAITLKYFVVYLANDRVAYSTFSAVEGVTVHVFDLTQKKEVLAIPQIGWHKTEG